LKKISLSLCITFCLCHQAQALDATPRPCSGWNTARKANLSTVVQREWVYGYLNGMVDAFKALKSEDVLSMLPANEEIVSRLNTYCESQPESTVNQGIKELFKLISR